MTEPAPTLTVGGTAIWRRQLRGGPRRITPIPVRLTSQAPSGNYHVTRLDGRGTAIVQPSNLTPQ